jgi:hypothetical protein
MDSKSETTPNSNSNQEKNNNVPTTSQANSNENKAAKESKYKLMTDADFDEFAAIFDNPTNDWQEVYNKKDVIVWKRETENSKFNAVKVQCIFPDIEADVLYDTLHDHYYRKEWDDNMIEGYVIEQLSPNNEVGYYSVKTPPPVTNRDFCNQRAWRARKKKGEFIIINHSVLHDQCPEKKGFIRAWSFRTGYMIRVRPEGGCYFYYYSHSDPKGWLPAWLINWLMTKMGPRLVEQLHNAGKKYPEWKKTHNPDWKPWRESHYDD